MTDAAATTGFKRTPLYALHMQHAARMVPFAGYAMPVQYPSGIINEHLHTRAAAGLFDVSHMGQIVLQPLSGRIEDAARALEALVPGDILGLAVGHQRYTMFTNAAGGVLDDLMVSNQGDRLVLVVNAARKEADELHLRRHLTDACLIEALTDHALVALQGPRAEAILEVLAPGIGTLAFMETRAADIVGATCLVSRSGYTGEDGFEIRVPVQVAATLCEALLRNPAVALIGLGARDSLRLEAGLCLYGADIDETTTPIEASLGWAIPRVRRAGGERAGGFAGSEPILHQIASGTARKRVGLRPEGRAPVRGGAALFLTETDTAAAGVVTSGGFGVSLNAPVAMGYVPSQAATPGSRLFADVRGKRLPVVVSKLPFMPARYKRP